MSSSTSSNKISAFKAARCDLLVDEIKYDSCGHCFYTMLDHSLGRTGDRRAARHPKCPKCAIDGKCLVCLQPWDDCAAEACRHCDTFFEEGILYSRVKKLHDLGLGIRDDRPSLFRVLRSRELEMWERRLTRPALPKKKTVTGPYR
ncbi:hypothetical protein PFICI_11831 [Pestalotiopsis fici W106-1]|uniref:Uncharacterized protein n=1 Tax=Pestalotiopsis fici (strain W106-1 / CGMCC3.15140) TaxID=1229662 RepID=W3WRH5_PESFW|nr:uncharacterized protein PFICI_11831 [Pestalotiopsis fici W106-1]ETS76444.1 hypothetical protein PFICI_11831 [Pestalotiopsis fici W106-1]